MLKDPSSSDEQSHVLVIDVSSASSGAVNGPLIFSIPNDDIDAIAKKLRLVINNAE